jgi:hypothetical protein
MSCDYSSSGADDNTTAPQRASLRVLYAVATTRGVDPTELKTDLYSVVDPEALDRLVGMESTTLQSISFEFEGHAVEVRGDGQVLIDDVAHAPDGTAVDVAE